MPALQDVAGQHIIIVCGHSETGGRKVLQQTLRERGAAVSLLVCYERKAISVSAAEQSALRTQLLGAQHQTQPPTFFLALSVETLDSLMDNVFRLTTQNETDSITKAAILRRQSGYIVHQRIQGLHTQC